MSSNKGKTKISMLAFVGGLVFISVAAGIILTKNEGIRTELEAQAKILLSSSRELLHKLSLTNKFLSSLSSDPKIANNNSTISPANEGGIPTAYDSLWHVTEQQNAKQFFD